MTVALKVEWKVELKAGRKADLKAVLKARYWVGLMGLQLAVRKVDCSADYSVARSVDLMVFRKAVL